MSDDPTLRGWLFGGGLVSIGGGAVWLWGQVKQFRKSRAARLEEREEKYVAKLEARLDALEEAVEQQGKELENHRWALSILIAKEERTDPNSVELRQVQKILGKAYPVPANTPRDMRDMLDKI